MLRTFLKAKIHRVTVTDTNTEYDGSITIDPLLLEAADLSPFEQVHIYNIANGQRFITYIINGNRGSGEIIVNGAAARLVEIGHSLIIAAYCQIKEDESDDWRPKIVLVDEENHIRTSED